MNKHRPYLTLAGTSTILGDDGNADSRPVVAQGTMVRGHETEQDIATFQLLVRAYNAIDRAARLHGVDARELALTIFQNPDMLDELASLTATGVIEVKTR